MFEEHCKSSKCRFETYIVRSDIGPEDIVPFLELAPQQLLRVLLNVLRLLISFSRSLTSDTSIVEPARQLASPIHMYT
jgi:hypothetical protein